MKQEIENINWGGMDEGIIHQTPQPAMMMMENSSTNGNQQQTTATMEKQFLNYDECNIDWYNKDVKHGKRETGEVSKKFYLYMSMYIMFKNKMCRIADRNQFGETRNRNGIGNLSITIRPYRCKTMMYHGVLVEENTQLWIQQHDKVDKLLIAPKNRKKNGAPCQYERDPSPHADVPKGKMFIDIDIQYKGKSYYSKREYKFRTGNLTKPMKSKMMATKRKMLQQNKGSNHQQQKGNKQKQFQKQLEEAAAVMAANQQQQQLHQHVPQQQQQQPQQHHHLHLQRQQLQQQQQQQQQPQHQLFQSNHFANNMGTGNSMSQDYQNMFPNLNTFQNLTTTMQALQPNQLNNLSFPFQLANYNNSNAATVTSTNTHNTTPTTNNTNSPTATNNPNTNQNGWKPPYYMNIFPPNFYQT